MSFDYNRQRASFDIPYELRLIFIINISVFILQSICELLDPVLARSIYSVFGLVPENFFSHLYIWQPLTYLFLHGSEMHIFFNMLVLWFLGTAVIQKLGGKGFLQFYIYTGAGAGIITLIANWMLSGSMPIKGIVPTVGASGSIYALLLAYSMYFPDRRLYLYFLFPIKSKWLVIIAATYSLLSFMTDASTGISHIAHLSGIAVGFIYLKAGLTRRMPRFRVHFTKKAERQEQDAFARYYTILEKLNSVGWEGLDDYEQGQVIEYHELVKKEERPN